MFAKTKQGLHNLAIIWQIEIFTSLLFITQSEYTVFPLLWLSSISSSSSSSSSSSPLLLSILLLVLVLLLSLCYYCHNHTYPYFRHCYYYCMLMCTILWQHSYIYNIYISCIRNCKSLMHWHGGARDSDDASFSKGPRSFLSFEKCITMACEIRITLFHMLWIKSNSLR